MLLHELDEDKNPARYYVLGNEYIGLDHNYYLTDEQGSVRYVLDAAGNIQNDYRYDELKRAYETNPEWNADPDKFTIVQGKELEKKRNEYSKMVQNGQLPAGHHIHGLADGGSNTKENIRVTGEQFINRSNLPPTAVEYYDKYYANKKNKSPKRIAVYEENGKVNFGKNKKHTEVTNRQNRLHDWQRKAGLRTKTNNKKNYCEKKKG